MDLLETTEIFPLLGSIATHFKRLYALKIHLMNLAEKGMPQFSVAKKVGMSGYYLQKMTEQAKRWRLDELQLALQRVEDTYRLLVTTSVPPAIILQELVVALITGLEGKSS
jgi:DNA polymerase III delta subunit